MNRNFALYSIVATLWGWALWSSAGFKDALIGARGDPFFLGFYIAYTLAFAVGGAIVLQKTRAKQKIADTLKA